MSERDIALSNPLGVCPASRARISFDIAAPKGAQLVLEHLCGDQLLARETRPVTTGASSLEVKTHPDATHVACSLQTGNSRRNVHSGVSFRVECGERIEPVPRHFIIIGAMKAGTTTLFELLANHPALCRTFAHLPGVSFTKEINYFTRQYRQGDTALHYDWRFPFDPTRHAWTLDASPNYAKWPRPRNVPERIAALGGETKLAYILREPVERIESQMAHTLDRKGRTSAAACIRASRYALQLDKFTRHIPRENILLLDFEQLRRKPSGIVAQVCDFLGIERIPVNRRVHNRRRTSFLLNDAQRADLAEAVRPDTERLVSVYAFSAAERWLRKSSRGRRRLFGFQR